MAWAEALCCLMRSGSVTKPRLMSHALNGELNVLSTDSSAPAVSEKIAWSPRFSTVVNVAASAATPLASAYARNRCDSNG